MKRCVRLRHRCELGIRVLPLPLSISSVLQKHAETLRAAVSSGYSLCDARLAVPIAVAALLAWTQCMGIRRLGARAEHRPIASPHSTT